MEVKTMLAWDERHGIKNIGTELIDITCLAGVVAVDLDATGETAVVRLETCHIVSLPAMHAQMEILHLVEHLVSIDTEGGITFAGYLISLLD